jgi:hypothetical protein
MSFDRCALVRSNEVSGAHQGCRRINPGLAFQRHFEKFAAVWDQPYLETCCRSALHRLQLSGRAGRPPNLLDGPCLLRIAAMGLCDQRADGRFTINAEGTLRHATEVLKHPTVRTRAP